MTTKQVRALPPKLLTKKQRGLCQIKATSEKGMKETNGVTLRCPHIAQGRLLPARRSSDNAGARRRLPQDDTRVTPAIRPCAGSQ